MTGPCFISNLEEIAGHGISGGEFVGGELRWGQPAGGEAVTQLLIVLKSSNASRSEEGLFVGNWGLGIGLQKS